MKKKQWKKQDLNLRSSSLKSSAIPTELSGLVTDYGNILLYLFIHYQTNGRKSSRLKMVLESILTSVEFIHFKTDDLLIHHQTKHMKSNKYTIYHENCIYTKSPHPNSVFCQNLEFFYHFPHFRMVESPPD